MIVSSSCVDCCFIGLIFTKWTHFWISTTVITVGFSQTSHTVTEGDEVMVCVSIMQPKNTSIEVTFNLTVLTVEGTAGKWAMHSFTFILNLFALWYNPLHKNMGAWSANLCHRPFFGNGNSSHHFSSNTFEQWQSLCNAVSRGQFCGCPT